jgi:hypothetical protein
VNSLVRVPQNAILICAALLLLVFHQRMFAADPYTEAARELAAKIMTSIGPLEDIGFTLKSIASLGEREVAAARQAIESALRAQGMRLAGNGQSAVKIQVTLSENFQEYIWIAEIRRDQTCNIAMTTQPRLPETQSKEAAIRMTLQAKPIFEQSDPILDVELLGDELLVLDPRRLSLYRRQNDRWELERSAPLKYSIPLPRDIRGRLFESGGTIQVHIPGLSCIGTIKPSFDLNCSQDDAPWPIGLGGMNPAFVKNYFVLENLPPFFSAASVEDDGTDLLAISGIDGRTYLYDKAAGQVGTMDGLGSDITAIDAGCETPRQIFASLLTDPLEHGIIQAFEVRHRKAVSTSSTIEFPGPITALWPVSIQNAAIAVSHDIKAGRYAAFYLSISCSR